MRIVSFSSMRRGAAAVALALALTGCATASPTPITVVVTPTPAPTATDTPTPEATATPTPAATPTAAPTPSPTAAPTVAASPTSAAAICKGTTADLRDLFALGANKLPFDVYCAGVLPSTWWMQSASYTLPDGGFLKAEYKNASGGDFVIWEGGWCPPQMACIASGGLVGPASFGGLSGTLYFESGTYSLQVGTLTNRLYRMIGHGMTQAQFVAWAAGMIKVPKS